MRGFIPGLLLAASLAGCLSAQPLGPTALPLERLSQPVFDLARDLTKEPLEVLAPDGARLDTFVYRPASEEPVPAILILSPYFANEAGGSRVDNQDGQEPPGSTAQVIRYFVPRGYAVVVNSVRGTGYSEGCFTIGGPLESKDHVAVVEAIIAQPWSSGAVAGYGGSYVGATVLDLLTEGHPAVKTGVPYAAVSDWYRYSFVNGVPINPQGYTFNYYYERDVAIIPPYGSPDGETVRLAAENTRCDHTDVQLGGAESAATGDKTTYWRVRDFNAEAGRIEAPVFAVHGLQDWNVKPDHLLPWSSLVAGNVPVKLWLGQWAHSRPNVNSYREEWTRGDWNLTLLRWFDHWLKGVDTGLLQEPPVDVQDDQGTWRHELEWPPQRAREHRLFLAPGKLQDQPGAGESRWRDTGQPLPNPPEPGAEHYALFLGEPLESDLRIAGEGVLRLTLQHGAHHGTMAATLWSIAPNGTAHRLNFGFHSLRHRDGLEQGKPVDPGETFALDVPLFPQDDVVLAGHRVALTLAGNDSPVCWYTTAGPPDLPPSVPLRWPSAAYAGSFACLPAEGYGDPGPLMQPVPSQGLSTVLHGEGAVLVLPVVDSIEPFQPPREGGEAG